MQGVGRIAAWRPRRDIIQRRVPQALKEWLDEPGSLTARLRSHCNGPLRVELLQAGWGRPAPEEARHLGMRRQHGGWTREVTLGCAATPWVFARTIIPRATLRGRQRALLRLGTRPLGSVLFGPAEIRRGPLEIARLRPNDWLYRLARQRCELNAEELWARRSILRVAGRPLLVTEVFLPALLETLD